MREKIPQRLTHFSFGPKNFEVDFHSNQKHKKDETQLGNNVKHRDGRWREKDIRKGWNAAQRRGA
jgi:hypothetical protein